MTTEVDIAGFTEAANDGPPPRLGQRLTATRFLPEAGNTVVCHLDTDAPAHRAVIDARRRMPALPGAGNFLETPVESLHMTVFEGVIETRRTADAWPADIDRDAPVSEVTEILRARLASFVPPPAFAVRVAGLRPTGLVLEGATAQDAAHLQTWRDALTAPFGYRHAAHDAYHFHMTFAYPVEWLPEDLVPDLEVAYASILADLRAAAPIIPLRPPAFCRFADMTHFEELVVLNGADR